jgi:hypothetical protein
MQRRAKIAILVVAILVVAVPLGVWLAAPLFIVTQVNVPAPESFSEVVKQGTWRGQDDFHVASGTAKILGNGQGEYILRLEDFNVRNGPDIEFFLSADAVVGAGDVALGDVPATTGSYNVAIPAGTDIGTVSYVLVHCVPFNVLFATAALA